VPRPGLARLDWAIAMGRSTVRPAVDGASGVYAHRGNRHRHLTFRFRLRAAGRGCGADQARKAPGCKRRTIQAPERQRAAASRAGLPLRLGAPARRRSQCSSAPRPRRPCRHGGRRLLLRLAGAAPVGSSPSARDRCRAAGAPALPTCLISAAPGATAPRNHLHPGASGPRVSVAGCRRGPGTVRRSPTGTQAHPSRTQPRATSTPRPSCGNHRSRT